VAEMGLKTNLRLSICACVTLKRAATLRQFWELNPGMRTL
jgi:hypothetical protein